jgi:FG-GAP-like repeat
MKAYQSPSQTDNARTSTNWMNTGSQIVIAASLLLAGLPAHAQPIITAQPSDQSVSLGASATFHVSGTSTNPPVAFQWRFNGTNLLTATNSALTVGDILISNAGHYDAILADRSGSVTSRVAILDVDPTFTKITTGSLVTVPGSGTACAWGDYDNDGFIDLLVTSSFSAFSRAPQRNRLFHNNGNGTFTELYSTALTSEARDWRGCCWADYDNDGNLDLFVTSTDANGFAAENALFRNIGNGNFTKMKSTAVGPITAPAGGSEGSEWADYDNDGFIDLFVARYGTDWLYHNEGDGSFTRVTNSVNGSDFEDNYGMAWGDYNNDGLPDLFVGDVSVPSTNRLYLNLGNGLFRRSHSVLS